MSTLKTSIVKNTDASINNIVLNTDGGTTFAGGGFEIDEFGSVALDFVAGTTGQVFTVDVDSDRKIEFKGDGSASFAGGEVRITDTETNFGEIFSADGGTRILSRGELYIRQDNTSFGVITVASGGTDGSDQTFSLTAAGKATFAGDIIGQRSTLPTTDGNGLGQLHFTAQSSTQIGAAVTSQAEDAWTAGTSYPSRLMFWTTNSGDDNPTERARIDRGGVFRLGGAPTGGSMPKDYGSISLFPDGSIIAPGTYTTFVNNGNRTLFCADGGAFGVESSIRASKKNIKYDTDFSWVKDLKPTSFNYRKEGEEEGTYSEETYDETRYGLIAEDVETVNNVLCTYGGVDGKLDGVEYTRLMIPMLDQLQKALIRIEQLEAKVQQLEGGN